MPLQAAGAKLGARALRVLIAIAGHADGDDRAYPSLATLARITRIERRGLHREISALVSGGFIRVKRRRDTAGDATSNLYTIVFGAEVPSQAATPVVSDDDTMSSDTTTPGVVPSVALTDQYGTDQRTGARRPARKRRPVFKGGADKFEDFWRIYPHRGEFSDPKKPARAKFAAAVEHGVDPDEIIAGAKRYRAHVEQQGTEAKYRPQAQTWLNQERWAQLHEPEPLRLRVGMN